MIYKFALCQVSPINLDNGNMGMIRTASGNVFLEPGSDKARIVESEIKKHPTALFFRAKAIKADEPNSNGDYFSEEELKRTYKSFEGVPFFTNHNNQNVENARGKVIYAEWVPEEKAVYTISFVDREAFPHICRSIEEEYINGVSMGCSVEYSVCNICQNKAEKTEDYCNHIKERKGRTFTGKAKNVVTGEIKEFKNHPVFEYNYGIKFIELSAVVDPACPSCRIQGLIKNDDLLKKVANIQNTLYMVKTAAIEKQAGQEEIQQLNTVLKTLEDLAIKLIQNRQQIEVEFASDLVNILSELQTFTDELVGAGYGNAGGVPGVANPPPAGASPAGAPPELPAPGLPSEVTPVAAETKMPAPAPAPAVGTVSGAPSNPLVQAPKLPITAPAKPKASDDNRMQKVASRLDNLLNKIENIGENDMGKRLTLDTKIQQKKVATEVLSNSWQEKQQFFEYINKVPSVQSNDNKLSVKKSDDSFVIVAEKKDADLSDVNQSQVWTYETLTDEEKSLIKNNPKEASVYFLDKFARNFKNNIKEGEAVMTNNIKEAGAKSVNKAPDVVTEAQLDAKGLYHSRTEESKNVVTEKQLSEKRSGEKDVVTEAQLAEKSNKLNPRTGEEAEVVTQAQLEGSRTGNEANVVTQSQLNDYRTNTEKDVVTERQLDAVDSPWERAAQRDASLFKSAGDHMKSVIDVMANTCMATGCTPEEVSQIGSSLVDSTKGRYELGKAILDNSTDEVVDCSKRLAYWSQKNIKVAGVGTKDIADALVKGLRKLASDVTINPEVVIDAIDVVSESQDGNIAISKRIDQKLEEAKKETVKANKKDELRNALKEVSVNKEAREENRKEILASVEKEEQKTTREAERAIWTRLAKNSGADTMIETNFDEVGCKSKDDANFKSVIKSFAKGALASRNIKLAAITNVTISGDTISIAVQTDEGEEAVDIPVGEDIAPMPEEVMPEGDLSGEGLEASVPPPAPAAGAPMAAAASSGSKMQRKAQAPMGGGVPGTPGGVAGGPGAPEAGLPGAAPTDAPVQALTTDEPASDEMPDEIPTAGEQQPPWAICPECGSSDVDVTKEEGGNGKGSCKACGAEYEALVKKEIEFKITKPTRSVGKEESTGAPEAPEVPALPVAAQTKIDKNSIVRISSNQSKHGHVCPACGMKQCKASVEQGGHTEYTCPACKTDIQKDVMINVNKPEESVLRVKWDLIPNVENCAGCKEAAQKFASIVKVNNMIRNASNGSTKFPMANCIERIARKWGGNSVATFGPCKGKPLADCVCGQLKKLGMTKVRHLEKLASVYTQKDPMDECIEDQMKNKYERKEAETICKCLKKKFASKEDDNAFLQAFADDIKSGREKMLTAQDMEAVNDVFAEPEAEIPEAMEEDIDIEAPIEDEKVTIEVSKETATELADAVNEAVAVEIETEPVEEEPVASLDVEPEMGATGTDVATEAVVDGIENTKEMTSEEEKEMAIAMQTHKILRIGETVVKVAATPKKVEDIEGNVEAGVPRNDQKLGEEAKADSLMNKQLKKPEVPRKDAYMGKEKEADSLINKELKLPDVAVDSSFIGKEKEIQKGMPGINNEIKGTVIADSVEVTFKDGKITQVAKKMQEVETVEKEVEAKVPRSESKLGEESKADSLINEPNKGPDVPSKDAYMGKEKEADSLINKELSGPDVPIDNAYMGHEKEVQKGMPGISDKYLKNVQQKKDVQLERIATARRMKAVEVAAKLLATRRITEDAYDNTIEALSKFEIDKITAVADSMFPKVKKVASESNDKEVYASTAIVMESKEVKSSDPVNSLSKKIASHFTIGNKSFDEKLTQYGEK